VGRTTAKSLAPATPKSFDARLRLVMALISEDVVGTMYVVRGGVSSDWCGAMSGCVVGSIARDNFIDSCGREHHTGISKRGCSIEGDMHAVRHMRY
jgi:hypothetical protein